MDNADLLYRLAGALTLVSGLYNGMVAFLIFIMTVWFCIGVWWLVPLALSLVQIVVGIVMIALGRQQKLLAFAPILGMCTSVLNLNMMALVFDVTGIVLGIVGYTQAQQLELEG